MTRAETAFIRVSFDAVQTGGNLVWHVIDDKQRNLLKHLGKHAGSVHFEPGDEVFVEVRGFGPTATYADARVLDAALITQPHTTVTSYSAPSPWNEDRAIAPLRDWDDPMLSDDPVTAVRTTLQTTKTPLVVIQKSGRWNLFLVLTMQLDFIGPAGISRERRVFSFDPESEVGTGADTTMRTPQR